MTDLKALLEAEANATPPPPIDTTATIVRIADHRRRRTAMVAGAAAVAVAATATFSIGNTRAEIPAVAPTTTPQPSPPETPGPGRESPGNCGKPVTARNNPAGPLRMTLKSARIEDKNGPWRIIVEVKVINHSAQTLSGMTGRGPHTMAAAMGNAFAFGGQRASLEGFELAPGASATYSGVMTLGDCIDAMDSSLGQTYQVYAAQTFDISGKSYAVSGGPWDVVR